LTTLLVSTTTLDVRRAAAILGPDFPPEVRTMTDSTDRNYEEATAAVTQAVTGFLREIDLMMGKWDAVAPTYIIEAMLVELCSRVSKITDGLDPAVGPATRKLLAALADYRDSKLEDR
jgi:hypothetical protein